MLNKNELIMLRDSILPSLKTWNQNRLFIAWSFLAAILFTAGIELFKILTPESYHLIGFIIIFIFAFFVLLKLGKIIDNKANGLQIVYDTLNEEIRVQ